VGATGLAVIEKGFITFAAVGPHCHPTSCAAKLMKPFSVCVGFFACK
jgi:hypothetical protein